MTKFERFQIWGMMIQNVLILLTLLAAVAIGIRQNEINQNLLDLNYSLSIEVTYDESYERINVVNKGQTNAFLWGSKVSNQEKLIEREPRLIAPGGFYYILAGSLANEIVQKIGRSRQMTVPFELYIETENHTRYTIKNLLLVQAIDTMFTIHTQTLSIIQSDWTR